MKKLNSKLVLTVVFALFLCQSNVNGQKLNSLINKVTENETVKKTVEAIKEDETVKGTFQAVKANVQENINAKIEELKNPKPADVAPAKALAPDVKNAVSELRTFTGLTADELSLKMNTLGFVLGTDDLAQGGIVYKSKTSGYSLAVRMGTRNGISYVREVTKTTVTNKANLAAIKTSFLKSGTQITDLKAQSITAGITAVNPNGTNLSVQGSAERTSKFLPAFNKFSTKKENGTVIDTYAETDYTYELKLTQTTTKAVSKVVMMIKVTDLTSTEQ